MDEAQALLAEDRRARGELRGTGIIPQSGERVLSAVRGRHGEGIKYQIYALETFGVGALVGP